MRVAGTGIVAVRYAAMDLEDKMLYIMARIDARCSYRFS